MILIMILSDSKYLNETKMAYNKQKIYEQAKGVIENNPIFFIEDLVGFLPISKKTFYVYFPVESDECNELKELIEKNKTTTKTGIRAKLYKSEKAGELLALYRLICTPEERRMLNQNYLELTGKEGEANDINITIKRPEKNGDAD